MSLGRFVLDPAKVQLTVRTPNISYPEYTLADGFFFLRAEDNFDNDGDGMPDGWEAQYFGTLLRSGLGDYEGDGVSDFNEYLAGTDPTVP